MRAETIYAVSSAPGRAAISVIRVSGPRAFAALVELAKPGKTPEPRRAFLATLRAESRVLDRALCLWFPAPHSATGMDLVEFHVHGGVAVVRGVLDALGGLSGLRLAEPGEFTRQAFDQGKMDLTQAEGLADLIDAETEMQAAQALSQMDGRLGSLYESWRDRIVRALAHVEAVIDFPDEDVPDSAAIGVLPDLKSVNEDIAAHLADGRRGEIVRDGLSVVILGAPNAGKSSLLNAIARRDVAIVSDVPGTTRDILEVRLNIDGYAVSLADTAGLRETAETVESEGIRRALRRAEQAHVRLLVCEPSAGASEIVGLWRVGDLFVLNKSDLMWEAPELPGHSIAVSAKTEEGLSDLIAWIGQRAAAMSGRTGSAILTRARHREALEAAQGSLVSGIAALGSGLELAAEHLRMSARAIGRITGKVDVEDVLDVVFRDFCIGK